MEYVKRHKGSGTPARAQHRIHVMDEIPRLQAQRNAVPVLGANTAANFAVHMYKVFKPQPGFMMYSMLYQVSQQSPEVVRSPTFSYNGEGWLPMLGCDHDGMRFLNHREFDARSTHDFCTLVNRSSSLYPFLREVDTQMMNFCADEKVQATLRRELRAAPMTQVKYKAALTKFEYRTEAAVSTMWMFRVKHKPKTTQWLPDLEVVSSQEKHEHMEAIERNDETFLWNRAVHGAFSVNQIWARFDDVTGEIVVGLSWEMRALRLAKMDKELTVRMRRLMTDPKTEEREPQSLRAAPIGVQEPMQFGL